MKKNVKFQKIDDKLFQEIPEEKIGRVNGGNQVTASCTYMNSTGSIESVDVGDVDRVK